MKITLPLLLSLLLVGPVSAAGKSEACSADAQKFCPDMKPGGGAIAKCLKKNESSLTPACKDALNEADKSVKDFSKACAGDIKTNCADTQRGGGRILACLKEHESTLSADCKQALMSKKRR